MTHRSRAQQALDHWRDIERQLQSLRVDAEERVALEDELNRTRAEYHAILIEARAANAPEPPPFPPDHGS